MLDGILTGFLILISLGICFWFAYQAKRRGFQTFHQQGIKVICRQVLSRSHQLVVFQYRDQEYLVSVAPDSMNAMATWACSDNNCSDDIRDQSRG